MAADSRIGTRLAAARRRAGLTQDQLAEKTGISRATLQRLERGAIDNPKIRYLINCSIVLGVELQDILEPEWQEWMLLDIRAAEPAETRS